MAEELRYTLAADVATGSPVAGGLPSWQRASRSRRSRCARSPRRGPPRCSATSGASCPRSPA
ncbi:hypothetical protein ACFQ0M_00645 [Kitasatospora aburaviensis]